MSEKALKAITKARSALIFEHPFFACLVMQLKPVERPDIETMATDGTHLFFNSDFVLNELDKDELIGVIVHEAYHCARKHHVRMGHRKLDRWNEACDYVVNSDLIKQKFKLPKWVLNDPAYDGLSPEEIYNRLPDKSGQPKPKQGQGQQGRQGGKGTPSGAQGDKGQGNGKGAMHAPDPGRMGGIVAPAPAYDKDKLEAEAARWDTITKMAIGAAKAQNAGNIPGDLERLVKDLGRPAIDWQSAFQRFVLDSMTTEYSWTRPNKRFLQSDFYFPGFVPDTVHKAVSVMDTSGSVTPSLVNKYAGEKRALLDDGFVAKLTVIYADTRVQRVEEFERGDDVILHPKGGGGTDFRHVMKVIKEEHSDAAVVVFFTDLEVTQFGEDPGIPVLWVCYNNSHRFSALEKRIPFGEAIHVIE